MKKRYHIQMRARCRGLSLLEWERVARCWTRRGAEKRAERWRLRYATDNGCLREFRVAVLAKLSEDSA